MKSFIGLLIVALVAQSFGFSAPAFADQKSRREKYVAKTCNALNDGTADGKTRFENCSVAATKKWNEDERFDRIHHAIRVILIGVLVLIIVADNDKVEGDQMDAKAIATRDEQQMQRPRSEPKLEPAQVAI